MKETKSSSHTPAQKESSPFFAAKNGSKEGSSGFFSQSIQAQLTVGRPDDPFEQEAEKVSRQVVQGFDSAAGIQRRIANLGVQTAIQPLRIGTRISRRLQPALSRTLMAIQAKCEQCEQEEKMQRMHIQRDSDGPAVAPNVESQIQSMRGSGQSMDPVTQTAMESSIGANFSSVRVHTNSQAVQMSQDLNAHAFTVGGDIFFNEGRYRPDTREGAGLLAHELTHTVQQGAAVQTQRISRLPYSDIFSNPAIGHLSTIGGDAAAQASLYRKEIAQFQQGLPEEELKLQQQEILNRKPVDKIQMKDNSKSLRRQSGGTPAKVANPKLSKKTVSGPTSSDCGGFNWRIEWGLDIPSPKGGIIVQKLNFQNNAIKCKDSSKIASGLEKWTPFWEAWEVNKGSKITNGTNGTVFYVRDDIFGFPGFGDGSKGKFVAKGTANFYEGVSLPTSFKVTPGAPAGVLPMTTTDPKLGAGSGSILHQITATWDCCGADKSTKITTV